jgi:hypothetical protein
VDSGEKMRFSLKTSKRMYGLKIERTYGLKCHSRRTAPGPKVRPECDKDFSFTKLSHRSYFPYSRVVLVEIRLIEGFS